jgi:transcriptional regulator with XRE-family HTH domain
MLEAGLDVKVAAAQVGLSPSQLSRIRRGRPTSVKTARLLCRSVGRLWGEIFESDGGPVREED